MLVFSRCLCLAAIGYLASSTAIADQPAGQIRRLPPITASQPQSIVALQTAIPQAMGLRSPISFQRGFSVQPATIAAAGNTHVQQVVANLADSETANSRSAHQSGQLIPQHGIPWALGDQPTPRSANADTSVVPVPTTFPKAQIRTISRSSIAQPDAPPLPPEPVAAPAMPDQRPSPFASPTIQQTEEFAANCDDCCPPGCGCGRCCRKPDHPPFGVCYRAVLNRQIINGLADQMVLYHYDFLPNPNSAMLSPHGKIRLHKYTRALLARGIPITIESTLGKRQLDEARRLHVVDELRRIDPSASEDWIVVGIPHAKGLRGVEAVEIDTNNIINTQQRGGLLPPTSTSTTSGGGGANISPFGG